VSSADNISTQLNNSIMCFTTVQFMLRYLSVDSPAPELLMLTLTLTLTLILNIILTLILTITLSLTLTLVVNSDAGVPLPTGGRVWGGGSAPSPENFFRS